MATVTSTASNLTLTANKNREVTGTISWSSPSLPSGARVTSCKLTGNVAFNFSKGSGTATINDAEYTSNSSFTVDYGTTNTTSQGVSIQGSGGNASGTVTFSNLIYTVTYTDPSEVVVVNNVFVGSTNMSSIYIGTNEVIKIYVGSNLVYGEE